jgi:hypothetical protein
MNHLLTQVFDVDVKAWYKPFGFLLQRVVSELIGDV